MGALSWVVQDNPGLVWNLISFLEALKENVILFFLSRIWLLDALKRTERMIQKRHLNIEMKNAWLRFKLGLALIGLQTTEPWTLVWMIKVWDVSVKWEHCTSWAKRNKKVVWAKGLGSRGLSFRLKGGNKQANGWVSKAATSLFINVLLTTELVQIKF